MTLLTNDWSFSLRRRGFWLFITSYHKDESCGSLIIKHFDLIFCHPAQQAVQGRGSVSSLFSRAAERYYYCCCRRPQTTESYATRRTKLTIIIIITPYYYSCVPVWRSSVLWRSGVPPSSWTNNILYPIEYSYGSSEDSTIFLTFSIAYSIYSTSHDIMGDETMKKGRHLILYPGVDLKLVDVVYPRAVV